MSVRPDTLWISLNDRTVCTLTRLVDETIVLAFDPDYEVEQNRPILSLSFKGALGRLITGRSRTGTRLPPFFSNLLPEGHLREYLSRKLQINSSREFFLLAALGLDLPGAVIARPIGELSTSLFPEAKRGVETTAPFRFSLAGVQLKFSAIAESKGTFTLPVGGTGGSWIVKLPSVRHRQLPETEYAMLALAHLSGITVPECKMISSSAIEGLPDEFRDIGADSLAVKRFDRTGNGGKIHMEDFAQVYGVYPKDKYEKAGYSHIARVLWAETGEESYSEFIRRLVFTVLIGNGDMHLKNWSLLYRNPQSPVLSPAYDFVPTIAYIENDMLALNLGGTKNFYDITTDKFKRMAAQAKAPEKLTAKLTDEAIEIVHDAWVKNRFDLLLPDETRRRIDSHIQKVPIFKSRS